MRLLGVKTEIKYYAVVETEPGSSIDLEVTQQSFQTLQKLWVSRSKIPEQPKMEVTSEREDWMDRLVADAVVGKSVASPIVHNPLGSIDSEQPEDLDVEQL